MTTLLVNPLKTQLRQEIRLNHDKRYIIEAICPYIYMHNSPNGTFIFRIKKGLTTVFSQSFTSIDLKASINTTNNYAHIFYAINPISGFLLLEKGNYIFELDSTGYTYSDTSYLGWITQHEYVQNEMSYIPTDDSQNSLAIRMKILNEGIL